MPPETAAHAAPERFPFWPLVATLAMQTLATMAAYSLPALAPAVARDLAIDGALIGYFISAVYGVGVLSSFLSPALIRRYGAVRVSQFVLACAVAMLLVATQGSVAMAALSAVVLGVGYGATAPASTHLLVPRTPPRIFNLVLSIRQIGVPLGGVLAALILPPLALRIGWQKAMLTEVAGLVALIVLLQIPRKAWDAGRVPGEMPKASAFLAPFRLLKGDGAMQRLVLTSFVYSGAQLCFVAFTTVHLTSRAGFDLVTAGQALAAYQIAGASSRPVWGWIADRYIHPRYLLALQGLIAAAMAVAAGQFSGAWDTALIFLVCVVAGATASGFTGIAYAEFARLGGERRTEATGLGSAAMFAGVLVMPSAATVLILALKSYAMAYAAVGALLGLCGLMLLMCGEERRRGHGDTK